MPVEASLPFDQVNAVDPLTDDGRRTTGLPVPYAADLLPGPESSVLRHPERQLRTRADSNYLATPTHPTCATSAESPSACCHRKKITEITAKKNNPPGIHMINAPIS